MNSELISVILDNFYVWPPSPMGAGGVLPPHYLLPDTKSLIEIAPGVPHLLDTNIIFYDHTYSSNSWYYFE